MTNYFIQIGGNYITLGFKNDITYLLPIFICMHTYTYNIFSCNTTGRGFFFHQNWSIICDKITRNKLMKKIKEVF